MIDLISLNKYDESDPNYYLQKYIDDDHLYISVNVSTDIDTEHYYTSTEYRELFMIWYNKIKPYLDKNDEYSAHKVLINWKEETQAKFDMYSLVQTYFEK